MPNFAVRLWTKADVYADIQVEADDPAGAEAAAKTLVYSGTDVDWEIEGINDRPGDELTVTAISELDEKDYPISDDEDEDVYTEDVA